MDFGSRLNMFAHDLFRPILFAMRKHGGFNFAATLKHSHYNGFAVAALHPTVAAQAFALRLVHVPSLAADESFVHFDWSAIAAKFSHASTRQGESQPMQNEPCRFLSNT